MLTKKKKKLLITHIKLQKLYYPTNNLLSSGGIASPNCSVVQH